MIDAILARLRAVAEADPFVLTETHDPFDFDQTPAQTLNRAYRLDAKLTGQEGYLGPNCLEGWEITEWLAQRTAGQPTATRDALLMDISSLSAALSQDGTASGTYEVISADDGEVQPSPDADYMVARLLVGIEFDRAL
jgi:hypothetical protein